LARSARTAEMVKLPRALRSGDEGFTLLEVMVALGIVASLLVTLLYTTSYNLDVAGRHEALTVATMLARDKMTELAIAPKGTKREKKGKFPEPYEDYSFDIRLEDRSVFVIYIDVAITEVKVTVNGLGEQVTLRKIFSRGKVSL